MGSLADKKCVQGQRVSGILVKKNFNYHILNPSDLSSEFNSSKSVHKDTDFHFKQGAVRHKKELCVSQRTRSWPWARWNSPRSSHSRDLTRCSSAIWGTSPVSQWDVGCFMCWFTSDCLWMTRTVWIACSTSVPRLLELSRSAWVQLKEKQGAETATTK